MCFTATVISQSRSIPQALLFSWPYHCSGLTFQPSISVYIQILRNVNIWSVECHADCIRLLAGTGMNICHEVWSLSTAMQPHTVYSKHSELLQSCYWKLKLNPTYGADLAHRTVIFVPVTTLGRSPIVLQGRWRSLISAMTVLKTLPTWDKCVRVLWGCVNK